MTGVIVPGSGSWDSQAVESECSSVLPCSQLRLGTREPNCGEIAHRQVSIEMQMHLQSGVCETCKLVRLQLEFYRGSWAPRWDWNITLKKMSELYPQSILERNWPCVSMRLRVCLCFFPPTGILPIKLRRASPDDITAAGAPTEQLEWGSWIHVPDFLMPSCCSLKKEARLWWSPVSPWTLVHQFLDLSVFCFLWSWLEIADWMLGSLPVLYLGTQYAAQSAVEINDLRT